jgi:hypothetical protein
MTGVAPTIDTSDVLPLLAALKSVDKELRVNTNRRLRQAAGDASRGLVPLLRAAGASSPTPQAALVARTVRIRSDRIPAVQLGGSRGVGHRRTPAGRLVWGSEGGGRNFAAASGGSYWIAPTVDRYARAGALEPYRAAVAAILHDAGVL